MSTTVTPQWLDVLVLAPTEEEAAAVKDDPRWAGFRVMGTYELRPRGMVFERLPREGPFEAAAFVWLHLPEEEVALDKSGDGVV